MELRLPSVLYARSPLFLALGVVAILVSFILYVIQASSVYYVPFAVGLAIIVVTYISISLENKVVCETYESQIQDVDGDSPKGGSKGS